MGQPRRNIDKLELIRKYLPNITVLKRKRDDAEEKNKVQSNKENTGAVRSFIDEGKRR